jgi:hypothetical protein
VLGRADREKMVSAVTLVGHRGMKPREAGLQKLWLQGDFPLRGKGHWLAGQAAGAHEANETLITATAICKTSGTKVEFE